MTEMDPARRRPPMTASAIRVLRYFNVAGADPKGRTGQSTPGATHLIKVAKRDRAGQAALHADLRQ